MDDKLEYSPTLSVGDARTFEFLSLRSYYSLCERSNCFYLRLLLGFRKGDLKIINLISFYSKRSVWLFKKLVNERYLWLPVAWYSWRLLLMTPCSRLSAAIVVIIVDYLIPLLSSFFQVLIRGNFQSLRRDILKSNSTIKITILLTVLGHSFLKCMWACVC